MHQILIVTLAEYQTVFWLNVARALAGSAVTPCFLSFDDRSADMIRKAGFDVVAASDVSVPEEEDARTAVLTRAGAGQLSQLTTHERFAFGRTDTAAMRLKLVRAILAAEGAIEDARRRTGPVVMLQEVGGFLSVIGSHLAARAAGLDSYFVEPSFFRGRMMITANTMAAPRIEQSSQAPDPAMRGYVEETLAKGSIVIPMKDAHQYQSAFTKVVNLKNARRLVQKTIDKYALGKQQEFGFIGHHVGSHMKMIANSRKLGRYYTPLSSLARFVYYPLHVPGDMALTLRSPEFLDQLALVDYLCRTLPDGFHLALKEHPAMVGALDAQRMIELLNRYDNLALLPPSTNNYEVMRKARTIVTVNSKSGAEAGLLGKSVHVLGDAFYRDAPFAIAVPALTELPSILARELATDRQDLPAPAYLDWFANVWNQSLPGELFVTDQLRADEFARSVLDALSIARPLSRRAGVQADA